jgi:hypothetical protein
LCQALPPGKAGLLLFPALCRIQDLFSLLREPTSDPADSPPSIAGTGAARGKFRRVFSAIPRGCSGPAEVVRSRTHRICELGGSDHVFPSSTGQGLSEYAFRFTRGIAVGGVEKIDPRVKGGSDDFSRLFLGSSMTKGHGAETEVRNPETAAGPKQYIFHNASLKRENFPHRKIPHESVASGDLVYYTESQQFSIVLWIKIFVKK